MPGSFLSLRVAKTQPESSRLTPSQGSFSFDEGEFREADHPRDHGKFAKKSGGGKSSSSKEPTPSGKFMAPQYGLSRPAKHESDKPKGEAGGEFFEKNWMKAGSVGGHSQPSEKQVESYHSAWLDQNAPSTAETSQAPLELAKLKKVGKQMGSNPGGVYENDAGQKFYVKGGQTKDHVRNELTAASLYELAGAPTLKYVPVDGGGHIATEMAKLDKDRAQKLSPEETKKAQQDFAVHAWLANWDAVGLVGDNLGTVNGVPTALDLGGALDYRAQGAPKGSAFGTSVAEFDTLRSAKINPTSAKVFGGMSQEDIKQASEKVTSIPDDKIRATIEASGSPPELADKLIARKQDIAKRAGLVAADADAIADESFDEDAIHVGGDIWIARDEAPFEESKHKRDAEGKFAKTSGGGEGGSFTEATPSFKTKKEHVGHLLSKGTTVGEILKATGWPSVSVPQQAAALGLKLEKYKEGGVTKYKGTPMSEAEKTAAKEAAKAASKAKKSEFEKNLQEQGGFKPPLPAAPQAPAAAPPPPPAPKPSNLPEPTAAEIAKAKKSTPFPTPYGSSIEATALVQQFNAQWAHKSIESIASKTGQSENEIVKQKIAAFKKLQADMAAANAKGKEEQAKAAAAMAAKQAEALKAQAEAAKAQNAEVMKSLGISDAEATGFHALAKMLGSSTGDVVAQFKSYEAKAKSFGYPITGFQAALISNYTNGGYRAINEALREGVVEEKQHVYVKLMNKALQAMPRHEGTVKRGATMPSSEQAKYKVGHVKVEQSFTSTSISKPWSGNTQFTIKSIGKRGAHVKKLSNYAGEDEVVFSAHTFFKVTKVEGSPGGQMHVHMEEMDSDV